MTGLVMLDAILATGVATVGQKLGQTQAQQYGKVNLDFNAQLKNAMDLRHVLSPDKSGIA